MTAMIGSVIFLALCSVGFSQLIVPGITPPFQLPQQLFAPNCTANAQYAAFIGAWAPTCAANSTYAAMQTYPANVTFCLTKDGRLLLNGTSQSVKSCICPRQRYEGRMNASTHLGASVPSCDMDGTFSALQYNPSTGFAKCVSKEGVEILSGRNIRACKCPRARFEATNPPRIGNYVPQCDSDGIFTKRQSNGSTGYSWCVNADGVQTTQSVPPSQYQSLSC